MFSPLQIEFEQKLVELELSYMIQSDGFYTISSQKSGVNNIVVQLINSLPVNKQVSGSKNGNEVQAIGRFKFKLPSSRLEPDILSFAFPNTVKNLVEFLIIPFQEFLRRRVKMNPRSVRRKSMEVVFWLMEGECAYDTTNISVEAEWYFMSKGVNGRMANGIVIDYSEYLNTWWRLMV